mmetsp:Transcript_5814/g.22068  ORF Transcript_5814/g.22068 Transcript_5814/m.22068 type:complete len:249 (-) Transcript_5814:4165-4911(-)
MCWCFMTHNCLEHIYTGAKISLQLQNERASARRCGHGNVLGSQISQSLWLHFSSVIAPTSPASIVRMMVATALMNGRGWTSTVAQISHRFLLFVIRIIFTSALVISLLRVQHEILSGSLWHLQFEIDNVLILVASALIAHTRGTFGVFTHWTTSPCSRLRSLALSAILQQCDRRPNLPVLLLFVPGGTLCHFDDLLLRNKCINDGKLHLEVSLQLTNRVQGVVALLLMFSLNIDDFLLGALVLFPKFL